MKFFKKRARLLLSCVIIIAFFIPAYKDISGFSFIMLAFTEAEANIEISLTDILITVIPLFSIFLSALMILLRSAAYQVTRRMYLALPFLFLFFFFGVICISAGNTSGNFSDPRVFLQMQPGFYITALASLLLIFTQDYKKKRHKKRRPITDTQEAAAAA